MPQRGNLTYQDFLAFPDDGDRHEILDGALHVTPAPRLRHQDVVLRLAVALSNHVEAHGGGWVYVAPTDVLLADNNIVEPDVIFVTADQQAILTGPNIQGAPALLIEVLSNPHADRVTKRDIYARCGVPEYWIADPESLRVEVYRLGGSTYGKPELFEPGDTLSFGPLPGLAIDIAHLFRD